MDNIASNDSNSHLRWSNVDKDAFMIKKKIHEGSYSMPSPHSHYYHELYYIASGNCNLLVEDKYYSLKAGHIIIIPANVSILTSVLSVIPLSYTNFPTHLIPFPHISASVPS